MRLGAAAVVMLVAASACGDEPFAIDATDQQIEAVAETWNAEMELNRSEPSVWRPRFNAACSDGVWMLEVRERLANQFMAADLITAGKPRFIDQSDLDRAGVVLWTMTAVLCPERFPDGAVEVGPPER